ncbi:CaiB/BaiF CoA transferase family protein [Sulfoacidibacillus thermotolerans]|uniref:Carnitine dehydratase n=1 Tax=Sulfoacidibacillus thermotolerans TaxID=1765684 RepID=A0A2U3D993_SULT2|nr:CoA transferase [Sulfoacidibacillus thermotolerans]PWI57850.1 hypothetical protein BM613_06610 [Sulfoacidibacillus thermotolerans]
MDHPLLGIRVLDFTQVLSGPFATMLLADAGADVVKVERPDRGDITRGWGPPFIHGESVYFAAFNRGKRSICLDLTNSEMSDVARRLSLKADVVIENLRMGVMERYGLGPDELLKEHPELIYVSIRSYPNYSSRALDSGLEVVLEAESGLMSITGSGNQAEPTRQGVAVIDMMTGMAVVARIYQALYMRAKTGKGEYLTISLEEISALMMTHPWLMYLQGETVYQASGSRHPNIAPYEVFQTKDQLLLLGAVDDAQFLRLATVLGHPEWAVKSDWTTNEKRVCDRDKLHQAIESQLISEGAEYWHTRFAHAKLPVGIVKSIEAAAEEWRDRQGPKLYAQHPVFGQLAWPVSPWRQQGGNVLAPPTLGNATQTVLSEWLGEQNG